MQAATTALGRGFHEPPAYFFLGDFSYLADRSRPESLVIHLDLLPKEATTFTVGDSMSVAEQLGTVYRFADLWGFLENADALEGIAMSDQSGYQKKFIELQVWDRSSLPLALPTVR